MSKTAVFDCAVNEKILQYWRRRGFALFFRPNPGGIDILGKENANAQGSARRGGGGGTGHSWNWLMHNLKTSF